MSASSQNIRPRRNSARISAQRNSRSQRVSSQRPGLSASQVATHTHRGVVASSSSQPTAQVVQPSPQPQRTGNGIGRGALSQPSPSIPLTNAVLAGEDECEILNCPICSIDVTDDVNALLCDQCHTWYHSACLFMTEADYNGFAVSSEKWYCDHCGSIRANKVSWGGF